ARLETLDTRKPLSETRAGDIARCAHNFRFFADLAAHHACPTLVCDAGRWPTSIREPVGVVGLITPWNLPLYLATWKIAPCLVMGNTAVLKPAEWTPYTATLLAEIFQEAGIPPGVFNVVHGLGAQSAGAALTQH